MLINGDFLVNTIIRLNIKRYFQSNRKKAEISIIFSKKIDGSMSAKDFILSLDEKLRAKTLWNINLLAKVGTALRGPESSKLDDGIFEIRTIVGLILQEFFISFALERKPY